MVWHCALQEVDVDDIFDRPAQVGKIFNVNVVLPDCRFATKTTCDNALLWVKCLTDFHNVLQQHKISIAKLGKSLIFSLRTYSVFLVSEDDYFVVVCHLLEEDA